MIGRIRIIIIIYIIHNMVKYLNKIHINSQIIKKILHESVHNRQFILNQKALIISSLVD